MILAHVTYIKNKMPKFYKKTVEKIQRAGSVAFLSKQDVDDFVANLRNQLLNDKPVGHAAHINYSPITRDSYSYEGFIYLCSGRSEYDIARIYLYPVNEIVTFSPLESKDLNIQEKKGGEL